MKSRLCCFRLRSTHPRAGRLRACGAPLLLALGAPPAAAAVTINFDEIQDGASIDVPIAPATLTAGVGTTFELSVVDRTFLGADSATVADVSSSGVDGELWLVASAGRDITVSMKPTAGGTFDLSRFDIEGVAGPSDTFVRAYLNNVLQGELEIPFSTADTYDLSANAAFQGIDELRIFFDGQGAGSQARYDEFVFENVVPAPGAGVLAALGAAAGLRRRNRRPAR